MLERLKGKGGDLFPDAEAESKFRGLEDRRVWERRVEARGVVVVDGKVGGRALSGALGSRDLGRGDSRGERLSCRAEEENMVWPRLCLFPDLKAVCVEHPVLELKRLEEPSTPLVNRSGKHKRRTSLVLPR